MDATSSAGCHKPTPESAAPPPGDVDGNGDLLTTDLWQRLRAAVGPDLAADVDGDDQAMDALGLLAARGLA